MVIWTSRKWDGSLHRRAAVQVIRTDDLGHWVQMPRWEVVEHPIRGDYLQPWEVLVLLPHEGWWHLSWLLGDATGEDPDGPDLVLYADVATATMFEAGRINSIDLDLDVARLRDGTVEMLDLDEFQQHTRSLAYPEDVVNTALETWSWLGEQMTDQTPPFTVGTPEWFTPGQ